MAEKRLEVLKVSTGWIELEIISEVNVIYTFGGYKPVVIVKKLINNTEYNLYITAMSLAKELEPLRENNNGLFKGIKIRIRKESDDKRSTYELEELHD